MRREAEIKLWRAKRAKTERVSEEMEETMKRVLARGLVLLTVSSVRGAIISADAEGYGDGISISMSFAGGALSSVGGYPSYMVFWKG